LAGPNIGTEFRNAGIPPPFFLAIVLFFLFLASADLDLLPLEDPHVREGTLAEANDSTLLDPPRQSPRSPFSLTYLLRGKSLLPP